MWKVLVFILSFISLISLALFLGLRQFGNLAEIEKAVGEKLLEIKKEVNTPPPLRAKQESPKAFLTVAGVVKFTNQQRAAKGLPALSQNSLLNSSAQKKVADMFVQQYFEHDSPEGIGVSDLAESAGYQYIAVGENLALGNFLNDETLVQGWMDSPGHRANILNSKYTEIGVAVMKGIYQGQTTWMAVQHFGKPLSDCPQPNSSINQKINENKNTLNAMQTELDERKKELDEKRARRDPQYNEKAEEYNSLVEEYNALVAETKETISNYNNQIQAFNACAS